MANRSHAHDGIRLLVVEENRLQRECLVAKFAEAGLEVTPASWDDAPAAEQRSRPNVVLLCARLPSARAAAAAEKISRQRPAARLMLLDERPRPAVLKLALELPVHGYWTQHGGFGDLLEAVIQAAAGQWVCCPGVAECLEWEPHGPSFSRWPEENRLARLSRRERQVLALLADGLSVKEIGERLGRAANTIDNHKAHLMRKLDLHKSTDAVRLALREGLVEG